MYKRSYFALDLKNDPELIREYERWHKKENSWPEVIQSLRDAGIANMEIYLTGNRLMMMIEVTEDYDPERKAKLDAANPIVQKWEELMWKFQQALPWATNGEKWVEMSKIFQL